MTEYPLSGGAKTLLLASNNEHKLQELERILGPAGFRVISPHQAGVQVLVDETGATFAENAALKARAFASASGLAAIADDSGLVVDALDGEPGVYSARYGGPGLDDRQRLGLVLARMAGVPDERRTARFISAICLAGKDGSELMAEGRVEGVITREPRGAGGFGYDPIFFCPQLGKTFGEASAAEKDAVSHRARALAALVLALRGRDAGIY